MLIEGNLGLRQKWLEKARMWRMVLLQRSDGSWDLTQSLAAAVEAHTQCDALKQGTPPDSLLGRLQTAAAALGALMGADEDDADVLSENRGGGSLDDDDDLAIYEAVKGLRSDDPLQFSISAMYDVMPPVLAALRRQLQVPATRVWATLLAMVTLEEMPVSWLASEDEDPVERTVVDAADAYLRAQAEEHPAVGELLRSGELHRAARRATKQWSRLMEAKVGAVRSAQLTKENRALEYAERASARFVLSLMTEHDQVSTFMDESNAVMRWQRWMILMTLACSALLVSIWFYQSRSAQCCSEMRAILNCESAVSCLGFTGSCADLQSQFSTLQGPFVYGIPPSEHADLSEYECHAFPDDAYPTDQLLVGLINIAIAIPSGMFLFRCFEIANEGDDWPDAWLELPRGWLKLLFQLVYGRHIAGRWHYETSVETQREPLNPAAVQVCRSDFVMWYVRHSYEVPTLWAKRFFFWSVNMVGGLSAVDKVSGLARAVVNCISSSINLMVRALRFACSSLHDVYTAMWPPLNREKAGGHEKDDEEGGAEGEEDAFMKRVYAAAGLLGVYVAWALYSWFIFTYGMLIYRQMGDQAQKKFTQSWGINFGLDSAKEWQSVAQEALKTTVILVVMDLLLIMGHRHWFEEHLDHLSSQATLFTGAATGWWQRTWQIVQQQKRLCNS